MITTYIAVAEFIGIIILTIYSLADNERIYASIFAAIIASLLSFILGYQFLFGMIQNETGTTTYTDLPLGYFFIMLGIGIGGLTAMILIDGLLKYREKKNG